MKKKKTVDIVGGIILFVVGAAFVIPSYNLGLIKVVLEPQAGPGMYPFLLSVCIMVFSIILIIKGLINGEKSQQDTEEKANEFSISSDERKQNIKTVILTILIISLSFLIWKLLGFYIAISIMMLCLSFVFGTSWKTNIILSVICVGFVYLAFTYGLKISFNI